MVCQYVDNDQTALQCRCLPDKEIYKPAASGRDLESGGGLFFAIVGDLMLCKKYLKKIQSLYI
jgi:hypothetical protein